MDCDRLGWTVIECVYPTQGYNEKSASFNKLVKGWRVPLERGTCAWDSEVHGPFGSPGVSNSSTKGERNKP